MANASEVPRILYNVSRTTSPVSHGAGCISFGVIVKSSQLQPDPFQSVLELQMVGGFDETQVESQIKLRLDLTGRTDRDSKKTGELSRSLTTRPLGNVGWNRDGRPTDLLRQTKPFARREPRRRFVDLSDKRSAVVPNDESAIVVHTCPISHGHRQWKGPVRGTWYVVRDT